MARIESYAKASSPISGADKLIGTDSANNNETKNFTIQEISDFVGLGPYKVYTALLTQSGEGNILEKVQGDTLVLGVTYFIFINEDNVDLTIFGAPNSNEGTYFVCTQAGSLPGAVNISLQYNTGAPVVTVLENTMGDIWFGFNADGEYQAFSDNLFPLDKTFITIGSAAEGALNGAYVTAVPSTISVININSAITSTLTAVNDELFNTSFEIRIYN